MMKTTTVENSLGAVPGERRRWHALLSSRPARLVIVAGIFSALFRVTYTRHSISRTYERVANPLSLYDPADEWQDDTWPLRNQTPWDISTDYPFPRSLEYDVEEGTWMRLDVHPTSGDIVFDLIGDLYCLPGEAYLPGPRDTPSRARPILLGVPHDTEPRFSPDGKQLAFRSDAELGVDNAWLMNWEGCDEMDVRPSSASGPLLDALVSSRYEEDLLGAGIKETIYRKPRRLLREGRMGGIRYSQTIACIALSLRHSVSSSHNKRDLSPGHGSAFPPIWQENHINQMVHLARYRRRWRRLAVRYTKQP